MTSRTAVLFDPHPMWFMAVSGVLEKIQVHVVGTASEPDEALDLVERLDPDLLVAEVAPVNGVEDGSVGILREAHGRRPSLKSVVLSASDDPALMEQAFAAGASAYVHKSSYPDDLASTTRQVFARSVYFSTPARNGASAGAPDETAHAESASGPAVQLTKREREVLRLVAEGWANTDLAKQLWVTEQTVKFHLSNVYRKLGVSNRTEASRWAQLNGLLPARGEVPEPHSAPVEPAGPTSVRNGHVTKAGDERRLSGALEDSAAD